MDINNEAVTVGDVTFTHDEIFKVVDEFYSRVQVDPVLKVPFQSVHDWPDHVKRLTQFWWIKFGGKPYMFSEYNPVAKHFFAGFNRELLSRWLNLFHQVLKEQLRPEQYILWMRISQRMGEGLSIRNEMFKKSMENK